MKNYDNLITISNSRSGHNFINSNIFSWLGIYDENWPESDRGRRFIGNGEKAIKYFNRENSSPQNFSKIFKKLNIDRKDSNLIVVLTRDYLNWMASLLMILDKFPGIHNKVEGLNMTSMTWIRIANEVYANTNFIPNSIKINYDCFRKNETYRRNLCDKIGGEYSEEALNRVSSKGYYSSFDGSTYLNEAYKMKVDERYLQILETEYRGLYLAALKQNNEALHTYSKYFNIDENKRKFIRDHVGRIKFYPDKGCNCI